MVTARAPAVLALDQGGHASRALVFDPEGNEVAVAHVPVASHREGDDRVEHDPEELVNSLRTAALDACSSAAAERLDIVAAGLATQRSTIVCWERSSGRPLSEALSWQDRRNAAWLARLAPAAAQVRGITGLPLSPHYGASKLRWCLDHLPGVQRAAREQDLLAGPLASFLCRRLLEERPAVADPANASRTLLFDTRSLDWSPPLLEAFDIARAILPQCVPTLATFGHIAVGSRHIPLTACTGDQSAAAFACGTPQADTVWVNAGTGAFAQCIAAADAPLPAGLLRSVLCAGPEGALFSHEGTVNGAGAALDWLRERVALDVDRALVSLPADAGPVPLFINGVGGLGAPFWLPSFPVEFVGDGSDAAKLTALVESVAFLLAVNIAAMREASPIARVMITGGLAGCDYLCQSLADVTGLAVLRPALREATARGVAFLAAGRPAHWRAPPIERAFAPALAGPVGERFAAWRGEMQRRGAAGAWPALNA